MKLKFYGARGSIPICDAGFQQIGGNTTCFQITFPDINQIAIVDAGTGIRNPGRDLRAMGHTQEQIVLAFTHFHWDHIQGVPFFTHAYDPKQRLTILTLGEEQGVSDLREVFETQMQSLYFPVQPSHMGAEFRFVQIGKATEHFREMNNADLLVHDGQYTAEELDARRGWGHSSYDQALQVAEMAGVRRLAMTHHDPSHDDEFLTRMEKLCQERFKECVVAKEGMELEM